LGGVQLHARARRRGQRQRPAVHRRQGGQVIVDGHRDGYFPQYGVEIKERFEALKNDIEPDLIFTHRRVDAHQDHRLIGELTHQTFRDHTVLEYEIPKFDGDLETPNLYVALNRETVDRKIQHLMDVFATQRSKHWFTDETFRSLLRLRGIECRARDGYAEGFHCRKLTLA
jgi:LmbE family N-acetylglucosaminyl deacetylase